MTLGSPWLLLTLAAVPAVVVAYLRLVRLRSERTARLAAQGLVPIGAAGRLRWRRHLPFALFTLALAAIAFSLSRPSVTFALPVREGTVILAFDVSNSMRADDLQPTRLAAAKRAALAFAERQPSSIRIGVVSFGDSAVTVLRPSNVRDEVVAAIKRLSAGGGTSLGQGLLASLRTIAGKPITIDQEALESDTGELDIGFYGSSAIIVLSDGENTAEPDPVTLAEVASTAGVHVHTIGLGTRQGTVVEVDGFSVATALDEEVLQEIAQVSDGSYNQAGDAESLASVYESIDLDFKRVEKPREVTALFAAGAGFLLFAGSLLSLGWFGRVI